MGGWAGRTILIGTRGSRLALAQANQVLRRLAARHPRWRFKLKIIRTQGDEFQSVELFKKDHVGVFTKAIEKSLLDGQIDVAVHSMKDLPTQIAPGLMLAAVTRRLDVQDVIISRTRHTLSSLPPGSVVGTGSPRRARQIALARPDLVVKPIRGNLDTRVSKVFKTREYDAVMVARAGLLRLGRFAAQARTVPAKLVLPAVGQAALGIQTRRSDSEATGLAKVLNHVPTERAIRAERALLENLGAGCRAPLGVHSRIWGKNIYLKALVFSASDSAVASAEHRGPSAKPEALGRALAVKLRRRGAGRLIAQARKRLP